MVVDLGAAAQVTTVGLDWSGGRVPSAALETSTDGLTYTAVTGTVPNRRSVTVAVGRPARYVAVRVPAGRPGDAGLTRLSIQD
jgi:hypothetical protein